MGGGAERGARHVKFKAWNVAPPCPDGRRALEESGLSARIVGQGDTVLSQYPAAGEILPRASTVLLYTEEGAQEVLTLVPALEGRYGC